MTTLGTLTTESHALSLPAGWQLVRLGEICEFNYGFSLPDSARVPGSVPVYGSNGIVGSHNETITSGPTIVIGRKGSVGQIHFSEVACFPIDTTYYIDSTCSNADLRWLAYILSVLELSKLNKASGVPGLNRSDAYRLIIPLPPLAEQKRITAIVGEQMAAVEKARAAAEERLEAARALRTAIYRQVFGDSPTLAATPLVPQAPARPGWSWHRLTDLARLATGHTPSRYRDEYWNGDIPWIQLADIRSLDGREAMDTSEHTNEAGIENSAAVLLPRGTVCLSRTASVGFVTIMGRPMATSQDFVNWVCGDSLDPWFLMHLFIANRPTVISLGSGAVHHTIYFPTVEAFSVCVPALEEQRRLVARLREQLCVARKVCSVVDEELEAINDLPAAILRRAFNGEL